MKNGFTLIELMIIIVIIGILAAVSIPAYRQIQADKICSRSPDAASCVKAKESVQLCRSGFLFDRISGNQIIGVNGGGVPCK